MKKLLLSVICAVAVLAVKPAFADETLCASNVAINEITVEENSDVCDLLVTGTLASGQIYTLPLTASGNLICTELKADLIAQASGVIGGLSEVCVVYTLVPFSGHIISVTTP